MVSSICTTEGVLENTKMNQTAHGKKVPSLLPLKFPIETSNRPKSEIRFLKGDQITFLLLDS